MKKVLFTSLSMAVVLAVLAAQAQAATTVAFWKFNEGSGTSVSDSSGNGWDGTASSSGLWGSPGTNQDPAFGGSNHMDFDGVNHVIVDSYDGVDGTAGGNDWGWGTGSGWAHENTVEFSVFYTGAETGTLFGHSAPTSVGNPDGFEATWIDPTRIRNTTKAQLAYGVQSNFRDIFHDLYLGRAVTAGIVELNTWVDIALVNADGDPNRLKAYINDVDVTFMTVQDFIGGSDTSVIHRFLAFIGGGQVALPGGGLGSSYSTLHMDFAIGARNLRTIGIDVPTTAKIDELRISSGIVAFEDLLMQPEPGTLSLMILGGALILRRKRC